MFFLAWKKHPRLTEVLQHLADKPFDAFPIDSPLFKIIEEFVIKVYDSNTSTTDINKARFEIFCQRNTIDLNRIPPTKVGSI